MSNNKEVLLQVEHLCQYFGKPGNQIKAVDDVSFDIYKGEVFGLVGESGCGKTTTGRSIIKLYDITSGNIFFKGRRIGAGTLSYKQRIRELQAQLRAEKDSANAQSIKNEISELREQIRSARYDNANCNKDYVHDVLAELDATYPEKIKLAQGEEKAKLEAEYATKRKRAKKEKFVTQIQMIFQDPISSLDPRMTVQAIIAEGLTIRGEKDKKVIEDKVYEVLETVGLVRDHAGRYPHEFSGGQRQRIGVARSVVMRPDMIIADEPVSALDVSIQAQVINLLNDLRHELGLTILFIAHDLSVVKYFSDRIGVMYYGKLVELANSDELFANPLHPYTKSLLSAIPLPDPRYEQKRKRIVYNPLVEHDYTEDKPATREVKPGHFVYCNEAELARYKAELAGK